MKKNLLIQSGLLMAVVIAVCGLFLGSCSKDDSITDLTMQNDGDDGEIQTRAAGSAFHWRCPNCGFQNAGWRDKCSGPMCSGTYSETHSNFVLSLWDVIEVTVGTSGGGAGSVNDTTIKGRIELPGYKYPAYAPEAWYETVGALKFYNNIKKSSAYLLVPGYAEDADFAWYRTTHILYPKLHDKTKVQRLYTDFMLRNSKNLSQGLIDGSKAAIDAFVGR